MNHFPFSNFASSCKTAADPKRRVLAGSRTGFFFNLHMRWLWLTWPWLRLSCGRRLRDYTLESILVPCASSLSAHSLSPPVSTYSLFRCRSLSLSFHPSPSIPLSFSPRARARSLSLISDMASHITAVNRIKQRSMPPIWLLILLILLILILLILLRILLQ